MSNTVKKKKFDPFNIDKPTIILGELGEYAIGDMTRSRKIAFNALQEGLEELAGLDQSMENDDKAVRLQIDGICMMLVNAPEDLADRMMQLYMDDQLGMVAINAAFEAVVAQITADEDAPNA